MSPLIRLTLSVFCWSVLLKSAALGALFYNDPCLTKSAFGTCRTWSECTIIKTLIEQGTYNKLDVVHCGFNVNEELICCPVVNDDLKAVSTERPDTVTPANSTTSHANPATTLKPLVVGDMELDANVEFYDFSKLLNNASHADLSVNVEPKCSFNADGNGGADTLQRFCKLDSAGGSASTLEKQSRSAEDRGQESFASGDTNSNNALNASILQDPKQRERKIEELISKVFDIPNIAENSTSNTKEFESPNKNCSLYVYQYQRNLDSIHPDCYSANGIGFAVGASNSMESVNELANHPADATISQVSEQTGNQPEPVYIIETDVKDSQTFGQQELLANVESNQQQFATPIEPNTPLANVPFTQLYLQQPSQETYIIKQPYPANAFHPPVVNANAFERHYPTPSNHLVWNNQFARQLPPKHIAATPFHILKRLPLKISHILRPHHQPHQRNALMGKQKRQPSPFMQITLPSVQIFKQNTFQQPQELISAPRTHKQAATLMQLPGDLNTELNYQQTADEGQVYDFFKESNDSELPKNPTPTTSNDLTHDLQYTDFNTLTPEAKLNLSPSDSDSESTSGVGNTSNDSHTSRPAIRACRKYEKSLYPALTPHILGGTPAERGEFPHMAALGYNRLGQDNPPYDDIRCGGTLISERFVVTAAHCVASADNTPGIVRMGAVNFTDEAEMKSAVEIRVKRVHIHSKYRASSTYNDIALLELEQEVHFTQFVHPTCLYTEEEDPPADANLFVTGWGTMNATTREFSKVLLKASLEITPLSHCNETYLNYGLPRQLRSGVLRTQLCAADKDQTKDACQGDSGGPLNLVVDEAYRKYRLVGIVASGFGCASSVPGLYTRVAAFLDFIEEIVWPNGSL